MPIQRKEIKDGPMEGFEESHESFGMIGVSRFSSSNDCHVFGSSVKTHGGITITISRCNRHRTLSNDWYHASERIAELELTENGFASLISNMNRGDGTPCSIRWLNGKSTEYVKFDTRTNEFQQEFKSSMDKASKAVASLSKELNEIMAKKSLTNVDRKRITDLTTQIQCSFTSVAPFVAEQFAEHMDAVVTEAKTDYEAHVQATLARLGSEKLKELMQGEGDQTEVIDA